MKIKKYIALAVAALSMAASAQNPTLKTFKVEFRTTEGEESILEVSTTSTNTFKFVGCKGLVQIYNETTQEWETTEEENSDTYINVSSVTAYDASISLFFSEDAATLPADEFGFCISKAPQPVISDFTTKIKKEIIIDSLFNKYDEGSYTIVGNGSPVDWSVQLRNLNYVTPYYVRPFIKLTNGFVMYGGEKSFTTLKTKEAALDNEEGMDGHLLLGDSIVIQQVAIHTLLDTAEPSYDLLCGAQQDVIFLINSMSDEETAKFLNKNIYKTIECVDGNLHLIKEFSSDFVKSFKKNFGAGIEFSVHNAIRETVNVDYIDTVYCNPTQGVPYDSYIALNPLHSTSRPNVSVNIPKYMCNKEYDIYAVLVHPDIVNSPRPYKLKALMYEREESSSTKLGDYTNVTLEAPDEAPHDGGNFVTDITQSVDTLYIGRHTFKGTPESYIEIRTAATSRELRNEEYSNIICISQIRIVPAKEKGR